MARFVGIFFLCILVDVACEDEDALFNTWERIHGVLIDGVLIDEHGAVTRISNVEPALKTWVNGESRTLLKANDVPWPTVMIGDDVRMVFLEQSRVPPKDWRQSVQRRPVFLSLSSGS